MFGVAPDSEQDLRTISYLHDEFIEASGGAKGVHSEHLLRSALARPLQAAFGHEIYKDSFTKAAALLTLSQTIMDSAMVINVRQWQRRVSFFILKKI